MIINKTLGNKILTKKTLALDNGDDDELMVHGKINHVFKVLKFALFLMSKKYYSIYIFVIYHHLFCNLHSIKFSKIVEFATL